jgi:PKD repeat protein
MKRLILVLVAVLLLLAGTVACSESETLGGPFPTPTPTPAPMPAPAAPQSESIFGRNSSSVPAPTIVMETPPMPVEDYAGAGKDGSYDDSATIDRMIIRSGSMVLVVEDVQSAIEYIADLATTYGGFVVSSNSYMNGDRMVGNIAIRVAVENFDGAISALRMLADEVRSESTSGTDVTEEYTDLEAQLRNLEAAEVQLLELMDKETKDVTDILEVQRELVKTRGQIEQTKGRMQYLSQSADLSQIQVSLEQSKLTVEFTASTRNAKAGQDIRFEAIIAGGFGPYSYEWDFGDGSTSTEDYPLHAYNSDGKYTVSLTVTDDRGTKVPYQRDDYINVIAGWKASNTATSAWNGLSGFGRFIINLIIWLGIFSPVWIVIGIILYFVWWRKRKKT